VSDIRIASLLASGTEIVVALGLEDRLVAISHECDWPPHVLDRPRLSKPRFDPAGLESGQIDLAVRQAMEEFGSVYEIDGDTMASLDPTLVITQAVCEVCAVPTPGVKQAVAERGIDAEVLSLDAHTLEDILRSIEQVGEAAGEGEHAREIVSGYRERIEKVRNSVAGLPRRRVLCIEWLDPPFAPGHWLPEMVEVAGGVCLVGEAAERSREVSWPQLEGLDPDVLVVMPCGYGLDASRADADRHAERLRAVAPRAVANGEAWVVDGSAYFNRSGPRTVEGVEILARVVHPGFLGEPSARVAGRLGERWGRTD
jgi:iron complex transport system substrate-binding protein